MDKMMKPLVAERSSPTPPKQFGAEDVSRPLGFPTTFHRKEKTGMKEITHCAGVGTFNKAIESTGKTARTVSGNPAPVIPPSSLSSSQLRSTELTMPPIAEDYDLSVAQSMSPEQLSTLLAEIKGTLSESTVKFLMEDGLAKYRSSEQKGTLIRTNLKKEKQINNVEHGNEVYRRMNKFSNHQVETDLKQSDVSNEADLIQEVKNLSVSTEDNLAVTEAQALKNQPSKCSQNLTQKSFMFADRYDLLGRKIIDAGNFKKHISSTFTTNQYFSSVSNDRVSEFSTLCSDIIFEAKFAVDVRSCDSMSELYNHEFDQHLPGYSLNEVCELLRSEVPTQRKLARQIMMGVLNRRDVAVCCQPYCTLLMLEESVKFIDSELRENFIMFRNLHAEIYRAIQGCLVESVDETLIRRELNCVLSSILLYVSSTDLPMELPFLIIEGLSDRYAVIEVLELTKAYLFSQMEEFVSIVLADGAFGIWGLPALLSPHTKRERVTYDEHITKSLRNNRRLGSASGDSAQDDLSSLPDISIMKCRYSRADVFVSSFDVVSLLRRFIVDAIYYFDVVAKTDESILLCGILSADILRHLLSKSSSNSAFTQISQLVLLPTWKNCVSILNWKKYSSMTSPGEINKERFSYCMASLVLDVIQISADVANALWDESFKTLLIASMTQNSYSAQSNKNGTITKILGIHMKILRCYFGYGMGVDVLKCIIAENPSMVRESELQNNPHSMYIYQLMEEASIMCSQHLAQRTNSLDLNICLHFVVGKLLDLAMSSLVTISVGCDPQIGDLDSLMRWVSKLNFISTVLGIKSDGCLSPFINVRGVGILNRIELAKSTTSSQSVFMEPLRNQVKAIREFPANKLLRALLSVLSTSRNSIGNYMSLSNWACTELKCATSRALSSIVSIACDEVELQQPILYSILHELDQACSFISSWGRNMVSSGLVNVQIERLCSIMALCALNVSECIHTYRKNEGDESFNIRDHIIIHTLPSLGKLFVYNMFGVLKFFFREKMKAENVNDLVTHILRGDKEGMHIEMLGGVIRHEENPFQDLQVVIDYSKQYFTDSGGWVSSMNFMHLSRHFHLEGIPIDSSWPYSISLLLKGHSLVSWIDQLVLIESSEKCAEITDFSSRMSPAVKIISLLYLTTIIDDDYDDGDIENQVVDDLLIDETSQRITQLLLHLSKSVQKYEHFAADCCEAANSLLGPHDMAKQKRANSKTPKHSEGSLMSLAERILDRAMSFSSYHELHVSSLTILLTPTLSWQPRLMIWRELGSLSILHLLETEFLVRYMPNLVLKVETNPAVLISVVNALQSLRSTEDRNWIIVGYGIFQICSFLYDEKIEKKNSRMSHVKEAITNVWLQDAISKMITFIPLIKLSMEAEAYCQQITDLKAHFTNFSCIISRC